MTSQSPQVLQNGNGGQESSRVVTFWEKVLDVKEAKAQVIFSVPMIVTNVAYFSIFLMPVMFVGHLGEIELAASNLAYSWATVTGSALMVGLSGALETLCGQAYGAELYRMLGIYLQASMITTFIFSVIVSLIWFYSDIILILLHQDSQVAKLAAIYLRYLIPGIFAYAILQCTLRFLQTQSVIIPLVICSIFPLTINIGLTYVMVFRTVLGFKGAALSTSLSLWISVIMLGFYTNYSKKFKRTWEGPSIECFKYVLPNLKLAIPSALMVCFEYWTFEILVVLAGLMPDSEGSTSLVAMCVNMESIAYTFTFGFSAAASTRVSNELGADNPQGAKNVVAVALKLSIFFALSLVLCLIFGHSIWASAFTDDPVIKKKFASMTPLLSSSIVLDSAQGVLSAVSRGCGWQHLAAWTNLGSFYVVGTSVAVPLGFKTHLHVKGLWIGLICGLFCQVCTLLLITLLTDWSKLTLSVNREMTDRGSSGVP